MRLRRLESGHVRQAGVSHKQWCSTVHNTDSAKARVDPSSLGRVEIGKAAAKESGCGVDAREKEERLQGIGTAGAQSADRQQGGCRWRNWVLEAQGSTCSGKKIWVLRGKKCGSQKGEGVGRGPRAQRDEIRPSPSAAPRIHLIPSHWQGANQALQALIVCLRSGMEFELLHSAKR